MMTFSEYLTKNPNLYNNLDVDEPLKNIIFDWFQFREVCDDDRFYVYFRRLINTNIAKYKQLLRIEPGVSEYDWMVQDYMETKRILQEKEEGKENKNIHRDLYNNYQDNQQGNIEDDLTRRGADTTTDKLGTTRTLSNDLTNTINESLTKGSQTDISKDELNGNVSNNGQDNNLAINDNKVVDRLLPMESSDIQEGDLTYKGEIKSKTIYDLSWNNATSQHQDTQTNVNSRDNNSTTITKDTRNITNTQGQRIDNNETTTKDTGTQTTKDEGINTHAIEYNSGDNNLRVINLNNSGNRTEEGNDKEDISKDRKKLNINTLQHTGRRTEISEILMKASDFIKQSCAFDYLRKELEPAFICFFEI